MGVGTATREGHDQTALEIVRANPLKLILFAWLHTCPFLGGCHRGAVLIQTRDCRPPIFYCLCYDHHHTHTHSTTSRVEGGSRVDTPRLPPLAHVAGAVERELRRGVGRPQGPGLLP